MPKERTSIGPYPAINAKIAMKKQVKIEPIPVYKNGLVIVEIFGLVIILTNSIQK